MCYKMLSRYFLIISLIIHFSTAQNSYGVAQQEALDIDEFIQRHPELEQFLKIIRFHNYFNNTLRFKTGTLLVPTNTAVDEYLKYHNGRIDDNTLVYHFTNIPTPIGELDEFISSDLPRNPPIWVTKIGTELFLNDARILKKDLKIRIGNEHVVHSLDRVLVPTVPSTATGGSDLNNPDAKKFLDSAPSYNTTEGNQISEFWGRVATLKRQSSYQSGGKHTFFIPINSGFQKTNIRSVDNKVIDGHIIPGQILFLPSAPLDRELQSLYYESADPSLAYQNFPIFISFEKINRTEVETWNVVSNNRIDDVISGTRYRKGKVQAEIVRGNIPVRNGVVHLIKRPLVLIDSTIYEVLESQGKEEGGQMREFFRILNDHARHLGIYEILQNRGTRKYTLFVPSNDVILKSKTLLNVITNKTALTELLKLHIVDQELTTDSIFNASLTNNSPLEVLSSRGGESKLHFSVVNRGGGAREKFIQIEGGGTSGANIIQADIGAINGVIHVIDRILGMEDQNMYEKLQSEYVLESTFRLSLQNSYGDQFKEGSRRFTLFAPSSAAWDKFSLKHPSEYSQLFSGGYSSGKILDRHLIVGQELTIEELRNYSTSFGRERDNRLTIPTLGGEIRVGSLDDPDWLKVREKYGEGSYSDNRNLGGRVSGGLKHVIFWYGQEAYVVRPNIKTTNGIIHIIDYPLIVPSDVVAASTKLLSLNFLLLISTSLAFTQLF